MRVAVTGATGFVGRHLLNALALDETVEIVAATRGHSGRELPNGIGSAELDIARAQPGDYDRLGRPDLLVHLAWGGLPNYLSHHHFEEELPAQFRFLKMMVEAGLPSLLVTGTCYEYGMVNGMLEEHFDPHPDNPYAFAKVALLRQLHFLQREHPFALTWARLFYMWGEGQAANSLYPSLKAAAARGDTSFPMSQGEQLRDYLPVEEVAAILAQLVRLNANCGVVNVSSGEPISVRRLVERWIAEEDLPITPELGHYAYPTYEPLAFWGSTSKRKELTCKFPSEKLAKTR